MHYKNFVSNERQVGVPVEIGDDIHFAPEFRADGGVNMGTVISINEADQTYTVWRLDDTFDVVDASTLVTAVYPVLTEIEAVLSEARKAAKSLPVPPLERLEAYVAGQLTPEDVTKVELYLTLNPDYAALVETLRNPDPVLMEAYQKKLQELING